MPRLFVAIDLPEAQREALAALRDTHLAARWTPPERFHLTLRFIGEVEGALAARLEESLADLAAPPFTLRGHGLGVFPSLRRPRVLFAAITPVPPLKSLVRSIEAAIVAQHLPPELKPYHPHVTLARLPRPDVPLVRALLQRHRDFRLKAFRVTAFHLYESRLRAGGARHQKRATFPLGSG